MPSINAARPTTVTGGESTSVSEQLGRELSATHTPSQKNPQPSLGSVLRELRKSSGISLTDLTVLSDDNDPFRLDTPANHKAGAWLRDQMDRLGLLNPAKPIHNRGVHYALVAKGTIHRPDGSLFRSDDDCWSWLQDKASKAARWLGYVPFAQINDARNEEPIIRPISDGSSKPLTEVDFDVMLPDLVPDLGVIGGFAARQPYRLVFWGEKTSLRPVLKPLADVFDADLYTPSGETSETQLHRMAQVGARDGREMVVLVFADCDPAGYQMAVSIGHKLRGLKELLYPSLRFRVHVPALTVDQVRELGLPSTPLKETELRAAGWRAKYGIEQTEIDALATLRPDVLRQIVIAAADPFFDTSLAARALSAAAEWKRRARQNFRNAVEANPEFVALKQQVDLKLGGVRDDLRQLRQIVHHTQITLPNVQPITPIIKSTPAPLVSSAMPLLEAIKVLRARKDYSSGAQA